MTAKEYVRSKMPHAMAERHVEGRIVGKPYWLIRDGRNTMYFAVGKTESNAWVEAKNKLMKIEMSKKEEKKYTLNEVITIIKAFHLDTQEGRYSKELLDWCNKWIEDNIKNPI